MAAAAPMSSRSRRRSRATPPAGARPRRVLRTSWRCRPRSAPAPGRGASPRSRARAIARRPVSSEAGSRGRACTARWRSRAPSTSPDDPGAARTSCDRLVDGRARLGATRLHPEDAGVVASCSAQVVDRRWSRRIARPGWRRPGPSSSRPVAWKSGAARPRMSAAWCGFGGVEMGERAVHLGSGLAVGAEAGGLLGGGDRVRQRRWRSRRPGRRGGRCAPRGAPSG